MATNTDLQPSPVVIYSMPAPTRAVDSNRPIPHHLIAKRQAAYTSVVHVTITAAGTVVYTQTATSYSYVPSYSAVTDSGSSTNTPSDNNDGTSSGQGSGDTSSNGGDGGGNGSQVNKGAIIGGVVGGVAFIALIALVFLLMRRSRRKREQQKNDLIDDDDSYYQGHQRHTSSAMEGAGGVTGMTSHNSPSPRHLVAPLNHLGEREGDGRESKYYHTEGGYYEDFSAPYPKAYYSTNNSVASDSLPSTTVESNGLASYGGFRQVPNEVDYPVTTEERHVPHLKDDTAVEPPHTKD